MSTSPRAAAVPAWRTCLDVEGQSADHYEDYVLTPLFDLMGHPPRNALELGCSGGAFGDELKKRYPGSTVIGIDAGTAAAARAATRLDRVIRARLDHCNLEAEGLRHGQFDTLIAADILEHLVNPWSLLEKLRPFLTPDAQVMVSIPNMRNITIGSQLLLNGQFDYAPHGLLDVTHLRFFTLESVERMFVETGYVVELRRSMILPALREMYARYQDTGKVTLQFGRMTLADLSSQEVMELFAGQFVLRCRPA